MRNNSGKLICKVKVGEYEMSMIVREKGKSTSVLIFDKREEGKSVSVLTFQQLGSILTVHSMHHVLKLKYVNHIYSKKLGRPYVQFIPSTRC